ncbi:MAG: hypothetical protein KBA91_03655 [Candidatus Moranbacteria bacterium]|nr:hypothetical protein [Candidatus Moranbacteria bacterium]
MYSGHISDYSRFTYDSALNKMLMFGGGHSSTPRTDVDVLDLNSASSLTWNSAYASTPVSEMLTSNFNPLTGAWISTGHPRTRHTYDMMPFIPDTGELTLLYPTGLQSACEEVPVSESFWADNPGGGWAYNPTTKVWRTIAINPSLWGANQQERPAAEYDPISHKVIMISRYGFFYYDYATETGVKVKDISMPELNIAQNLVYYPPNGKMYYIENDGTVFEVTLDRDNLVNSTIVQMTGITGSSPTGAMPPVTDSGETGWAYDSLNQIIGGGIVNDTFYAFDPIAKTWTAKLMHSDNPAKTIGKQSFHALDYDPIDNVFIFLSLNPGDSFDQQGSWAFRYDGTAVLDTTAPTITSVTSSTTNGTYGVGATVNITINFSEAVTSTGNVTVTLETGTTDRTCTFTISNAASGSCTYTVQSGDTSSDLTTQSISGAIADQSSNALVNFSPATNLAANKALVIDTTVVADETPVVPESGTVTQTKKSSSHSSKKKKTTKPFSISQSSSSLTRGSVLVQRGKKFSKSNTVQLFFETRPGSFGKQILRTDVKGKFITSFRVNKPAGIYRWYAVDTKTGRKSASRWYKVR